MNLLDALTLQAFSLARLHLNSALPQELVDTVYQMGRAIARHQPNVAQQIREFVQQHGCLREPYEQAYRHLQQRYQVQEQAITQVTNSLPEAGWQRLVVDILVADDPKAIVEEEVLHLDDSMDIGLRQTLPQPYLTALQQEVATLDQQANNILKVLERQLLTVEDLSYVVNLPIDQTRAIVQRLWKKGYIDTTKRTPLHRLMSFIGNQDEPHEVGNQHSFNLTAKGHFYLHPLVVKR
jgi:hypothetical protein